MKNPDVSIIIPVYNSQKYIHQCLKSVLAQSITNIEILLVDDGSTDNSGFICDEYSKKYSNVIAFHQKNGGASKARNLGVKSAKGRYICFVDSDDIISPIYCEEMLRLLDKSVFDFCVCGSYRFADENTKLGSFSGVSGILSNEEYLWAQLHRKSEFGFINKLFRRELFESLSFREGVHNEDVIFSCDLARKLHNGVICTEKELYGYRMNESGVTFGQKAKADPDFIHAAEYLVETARILCPDMVQECLLYAVGYPWSFVDKIYLNKEFIVNRQFLEAFRAMIKRNMSDYIQMDTCIDAIKKYRMILFTNHPVLYFFNVYGRLFRLYLFKVLKLDPYKSGHGI